MGHEQLLNELRGLIMDTVRKADSGHTGGALSSLDFATILFRDYLRYDPADPGWQNRDRFVLSAGHESALLYSLLYSIGYLELDDLTSFRQWGSRTPGHPERGLTPGVEATTGPLGQGVAMAVGMAVAEEMLRDRLGSNAIEHYTYCLCGDGDLQEPVALGACALAGHWKLGRLVAYYDRNQVQISGSTDRVDSTVYEQLFKSIGWQVLEVDGHSEGRIKAAIQHAHQATEQPTLIIGNTTMAHGTATVEGLAATHGAPLAPEEIAATKEKLGLLPDQYFQFSDAAFAGMRTRHETLRTKVGRWQTVINKKREDTEFDALWRNYFGELASDDLPWPSFEPGSKIATRKAFGQVLDALAPALPVLVGGSADLEPSNNTANFAKQYGDFNCDNRGGRSLAYGVREFPMGAINNGIALHGGLIPFGATFLVFTDYEKPALRLRALQKLHAIGIYTHDSIYVGEDGPTHQPVEQIMSLRLIPDMLVFRPADATETVASMRAILTRTDRPSALVLSRQSLPVLQSDMQKRAVVGVQQGAYVIKEAEQEAQVTIFAAGSEVSLALEVCDLLTDTAIRVISAPCWELFFEQPVDYQESILDSGNALAVSIEAGATAGWERFTGNQGLNIGIDCFGASAPGDTVARQLGLDPAAISARITQILKERET